MSEGIDDLETFMELNEQDFSRLQMKTKLIKCIQRIQREISSGLTVEEFIVERLDPEDESYRNENAEVDDQDTDEDCVDSIEENPYHGIRLEKVSKF